MFLPKQSDAALDRHQRIVLVAIASRKSSYGGVKDFRFVCANEYTGITRSAWDTAKAGLIARGLLNKAGALTVEGKHAHSDSGAGSVINVTACMYDQIEASKQ